MSRCSSVMRRLRKGFGPAQTAPFEGPHGELLGGVIVCRDISQLKEEESFARDKAGFWK